VFFLVAAITQPSTVGDLLLAAVPIAAFGLWAFAPNVPLAAVSVAIVVPVVVVQRSGQLEPVMFDACLLSFAAARWSPSVGAAVSLGALAVATPVLVAVVQDPMEVARSLVRNDSWSSSRGRGVSWQSRRWWRSAVGSLVTSTISSVTA
jgi:hypothetical protein